MSRDIGSECENILCFAPSGLVDEQVAAAHFDALATKLKSQRKQFGIARVLVDLRDSSVQQQDTAQRIEAGARKAYEAGDRVAIVTSSSLLKLQMVRVRSSATTEIFATIEEAERWLLQPAD